MNVRGRWTKVALAVTLVLAVVVIWRSGIVEDLDRETLRAWAKRAGWWGPAAFVGLFAIGEVLHVPSVIFVVVSGLVWPTSIALATSYVGAMVASATVFIMARYLVSGAIRDAIVQRMPEDLKRYDESLETKGVRTVALIRLFTFMAPAMHWVLATSRVKFGDMMLGTAIGLVPGITALVLAGDAAVRYWEIARPWILGGMVALVVGRVITRRRKRSAG
jgi:phospholipase D1/2